MDVNDGRQKKVHCTNTKMNLLLRYVFTNEPNFSSSVTGLESISEINDQQPSFDERLSLPHRSTVGKDYPESLKELFDCYQDKVKTGIIRFRSTTKDGKTGKERQDKPLVPLEPISELCKGLLNVLKEYHRGLPANAFQMFADLLNETNRKNHQIPMVSFRHRERHPGPLFRIRHIDDGLSHSRKDIFHPDFSLRHIIGTNRYSIAGYPTLYLADNMELSQSELGDQKNFIASCFMFVDNFHLGIVDFGLRPRDFSFIGEDNNREFGQNAIPFSREDARRYLIWFPLIAACSFIRAHPGNPYADEYILPQLLMQWIRTQSVGPIEDDGEAPPTGPVAPNGIFPISSKTLDSKSPDAPDAENYNDAQSVENTTGSYDRKSSRQIIDYVSHIMLLSKAIRASYESLDQFPDTLSERELRALKRLCDSTEQLERLTREIVRLISNRRSLISLIDEYPSIETLEELRDRIELYRSSLIRFVNYIKNALDGENGGRAIHLKAPDGENSAVFLVETLGVITRTCAHLYNTRVNLNWIINLPTNIIGIRYFSCKNDVAPTLGSNYAFPMEPTMDNGREVSSLNSYFNWTKPVNIADFSELNDCERYLLDLASKPSNLGNCITT